MSDMIEYKGYLGSVEFSAEDEALHGKLQFVDALVLYEATDIHSLKSAFHDAVDDYIELCDAEGVKPEVPCIGRLNMSPGRELHLRATRCASRRRISLNKVVCDALRSHLDREDRMA